MEKIAMLDKVLWIETHVKKLNHGSNPEWTKKHYQAINDNLISLKFMLQSPDTNKDKVSIKICEQSGCTQPISSNSISWCDEHIPPKCARHRCGNTTSLPYTLCKQCNKKYILLIPNPGKTYNCKQCNSSVNITDKTCWSCKVSLADQTYIA